EAVAHPAAGEEAHVGVLLFGRPVRSALALWRERGGPCDRCDPAGDRRQRTARIEVRGPRREREASVVRDRAETEAREEAPHAAGLAPLREHLARAFHDPTVRHARRAHGLARAADETRVEMRGEVFARNSLGRDERSDEL